MITEADVRAALSEVPYPGLRRDIVSLGMLRSVTVNNDRVHVSLTVATEREEVPGLLRAAVKERLERAGALRTEVQLLTPGRKPADGDPWRKQKRLSNARSVIAVGAGKGSWPSSGTPAVLADQEGEFSTAMCVIAAVVHESLVVPA